jgi:uncharacterized DUF497 family protein
MSGIDPSQCTGFEWDKGNAEKNWRKHHVTPSECEQIFFNQPLVIAPDEEHSQKEPRYFALGQTDMKRSLLVVFTIRKDLFRVICARDMSRREREAYRTHETKNS